MDWRGRSCSQAPSWRRKLARRRLGLHKGRPELWAFAASRILYIAIGDVRIPIASIDQPRGQSIVHLNGPKPLTALDALAIAERVTGQTFKVQRLPIPVIRVLRVVLKSFSPAIGSLLAIAVASEQGEAVDMRPLLDGRHPTNLVRALRAAPNKQVALSKPASDVTALLRRWGRGDRDAGEQAAALIYDELHRCAAAHMRRERRITRCPRRTSYTISSSV